MLNLTWADHMKHWPPPGQDLRGFYDGEWHTRSGLVFKQLPEVSGLYGVGCLRNLLLGEPRERIFRTLGLIAPLANKQPQTLLQITDFPHLKAVLHGLGVYIQ